MARATPEDLAPIAGRVVQTLALAAALFPSVEATVDAVDTARALSGAPVWVARRAGALVGHLTASIVPVGDHDEAWLSPDAWSYDALDDLAALYADAASAWRVDGVREHVVWSFDDPRWTEGWLELGFAREVRRGARTSPARPVSAPPGYRLRRARFQPTVAAALSALVDEAETGAPTFRRRPPVTDPAPDDRDGRWYVVEHRSEVVAQCLAMDYPPTLGVRTGTTHLSAVAVRPEHRRRGLARALVEYVAARERASVLDVAWRTANRPASALWASRGFSPVAIGLRRTLPG